MSEYAEALGTKLRATRLQQRLSLHRVEQKSAGRWKAVVVGSYERGDRAVTAEKLAELADFYGVPVLDLLPVGRMAAAPHLVIDLQRLHKLPAEQVGPLVQWISTVQSVHGDYDGKVLPIRVEDLCSMAMIYGLTPDELTAKLIDWGVLVP